MHASPHRLWRHASCMQHDPVSDEISTPLATTPVFDSVKLHYMSVKSSAIHVISQALQSVAGSRCPVVLCLYQVQQAHYA